MIKKSSIRAWSRLGQRGSVFGVKFPELAKELDHLKLITADLSLLSGMERFIRDYPEKFLNVGIAEQNMIGIASGLSMEGYTVFATTYASFIAVRSLEHIRQHLAHMKCNVKLIGSSAGVVAAKSGISHWATEDIAFMRALPNMMVFSPSDCLEAMKIVEYAAKTEGPMYIRLSGGLDCKPVFYEDFDFIPGRNVVLREGKDVAILATGLMVQEALQAAEILSDKNISAEVINVSTIKPLDEQNLSELCGRFNVVCTVEEHNIIGGLGGAVAEYLSGMEQSPRLIRFGIHDCYMKAGGQRFIWDNAGLTAEKLAIQIQGTL